MERGKQASHQVGYGKTLSRSIDPLDVKAIESFDFSVAIEIEDDFHTILR